MTYEKLECVLCRGDQRNLQCPLRFPPRPWATPGLAAAYIKAVVVFDNVPTFGYVYTPPTNRTIRLFEFF